MSSLFKQACREMDKVQVTIPAGLSEGMYFQVTTQTGEIHTVTVPKGHREGMTFLFDPQAAQPALDKVQVFVPPNVQSGQQLEVQTEAGPLEVEVPPGVDPGATLEVQMPASDPPPQATPTLLQAELVTISPVSDAVPLSSQANPLLGSAAESSSSAPIHAMVAPAGDHIERDVGQQPTPSQPAMTMQSRDVPVGTPIEQAMPQLPAADSLKDQYSGYAFTPEEPSYRQGFVTAEMLEPDGALPMGRAVFYTDAELAVLNQQPVPTDMFSAGVKRGGPPLAGQSVVPVGVRIAQDASVAVAQPVLVTRAGVPIVNTQAAGLSAAKTEYDGWAGIKSCDLRLQGSVDELMLYFNTHNTRPLVGCEVEGWHHETRHHHWTDSKGNRQSSTRIVKVSDFKYKVDLTQFVYPYGYIASVDENHLTVPQLCQKFVNDTNKLKSLSMEKHVRFNFHALHSMVCGYIRSLGWRRGLTVRFPKANRYVRVYNENCLSMMWEDYCINVLCHLTIVPCCVMRCYQNGHKEEDIRSYFRIDYAPIQVFEAIKPQLWCPGYSGTQFALELLRNMFW